MVVKIDKNDLICSFYGHRHPLKASSFLTTCAGWALTCASWPLVPLPSPETKRCIPPQRSANKPSTA